MAESNPPSNPGMAGDHGTRRVAPPPAGAISERAGVRRNLEAAGDDDPDAALPEATAAAVAELYQASGRDPEVPGKM